MKILKSKQKTHNNNWNCGAICHFLHDQNEKQSVCVCVMENSFVKNGKCVFYIRKDERNWIVFPANASFVYEKKALESSLSSYHIFFGELLNFFIKRIFLW